MGFKTVRDPRPRLLLSDPWSSRHRLAYISSGLCSICASLHHLGVYPPYTFELYSPPIWKDFSLLANRLSFRPLFLRPCLPATSDAHTLPWRGQHVASPDREQSSPAPALSDNSSTLQSWAALQSGWRRKSLQRQGMTSLFDPCYAPQIGIYECHALLRFPLSRVEGFRGLLYI